MAEKARTYIAIDLKSFYASVECVDRGLDPLTTNLVVADASRTDKTICLAVTPSLKAYGISGRARMFEMKQQVAMANWQRRQTLGIRNFCGKSSNDNELKEHPDWEIDYIVAVPRMARYMEFSTNIYKIYLKYIAPEDIHVYSIDEVFIDVTEYLPMYKKPAHDIAMMIIKDVLKQTGVTATAGIGTNLYLCKVAMDIVAKHIPADKDGVRIAELDEKSYREKLWDHKPLTSFWRIGHGIAERLAPYGIDTMGKLARLSIENEQMLYNLFGVNAELLIDHAWGYEPCTIDKIKSYRPERSSLSSGQVLQSAYDTEKALIVVREMADGLALDMVEKMVVTNQIVLTIGYESEQNGSDIMQRYDGPMSIDHYGRRVPKHAHGSINLDMYTSSSRIIIDNVVSLYRRIINPVLQIRRINITANNVISEYKAQKMQEAEPEQLSIFEEENKRKENAKKKLKAEHALQKAILAINKKYDRNCILRGTSYEEGATAKERNKQIGGHKA